MNGCSSSSLRRAQVQRLMEQRQLVDLHRGKPNSRSVQRHSRKAASPVYDIVPDFSGCLSSHRNGIHCHIQSRLVCREELMSSFESIAIGDCLLTKPTNREEDAYGSARQPTCL